MKKFKKKSLLIIGKKPLPIGGVTIHVSRLTALLDKMGQRYDFYDLNQFHILSFIQVIRFTEYAHLHCSSPLLRLCFVIVCKLFNTKALITYHGDLGRFSFLYNLMDNLSVRGATIPIVINEKSYSKAILFNKKTVKISAYIPAVDDEKLDPLILDKINKLRNKVNFVVCTNAYNFTLDHDRNEIYGIKILADLFNKHHDWGLIVSDPSGSYSKLLGGLERNILIISEPHCFIRVLEKSNCFIRYTSTDGDSLSIHEALDCGVQVIATDVVDRPENVHLVSRGNADQLAVLLDKLKYETSKCGAPVKNLCDNEVLKLYQKLIKENETNYTRP